VNIRDLKYLVAVADHNHFGRAAEACFVSQPTLSMQLKKLEEELGITVFERSNKQILITDIGEKIVAKAREILLDIEGMKSLAQTAHDPMVGPLRLGVIPTVAPYLLPHVMSSLVTTFPKLELYLIEEKTPNLVELLDKGKVDAAIMALPNEETLEYQVLYEEPFYLACAKSNQMSEQLSVSMESLMSEKIMLLEEGHCLRSQAMDICHQVKAQNIADFSATSLETLRLMVAAGNGVTLLPALSVTGRDQDDLSILPFNDSQPFRQIALFWRGNSSKKRCFSNITSVIIEEVAHKTSTLSFD